MSDWEIRKPLGQCSGTGREFEIGQEYYAALVETEEGLERRDFSTEYWQEQQPQVYCFWKTRLPDPQEKKKLLVSDEMLMTFFERLEGETDPEKVKFRYVLTLILMRKRKLKYESSDLQDGQEVWTCRVAGEGRSVEVIDPHLAEDQIEELSSQMGQILQVDFE